MTVKPDEVSDVSETNMVGRSKLYEAFDVFLRNQGSMERLRQTRNNPLAHLQECDALLVTAASAARYRQWCRDHEIPPTQARYVHSPRCLRAYSHAYLVKGPGWYMHEIWQQHDDLIDHLVKRERLTLLDDQGRPEGKGG